MSNFLSIIILLVVAVAVSGQSAVINDSVKIVSSAGEAQSTVVPPGKKMDKCQQGRFLVTNDRKSPADNAVVTGQDIDKPGITASTSKFDMGSIGANYDTDFTKSKYWFGTNDHDIVTLSNGDVLYITGAFSRMPMSPSRALIKLADPSWFNDTYRCMQADNAGTCLPNQAFGPGARSVVLVFRSTDCGENFTFVSEMDPMHVDNGLCAMPQFRHNWSLKNAPKLFTKPWDMGGTDGQLVKVDPANDHVYMTFQCVGYNPVDPKAADFVLDQNNKINKTLVMMLDPSLSWSWKNLGYIDEAMWRFSLVPFGNEMDLGYGSSVVTGKKNASGKYDFDSAGIPAPKGSFNWMGEWNFKDSAGNSPIPVGSIGSNVLAVPVVARTPDSNSLMLAFPDNFSASGWGYRVAFYDRTAHTITDASDNDSILPATANTNNVVFHLAVADPGSGPVLLYWTDLDSAAKTITVRGRLITGKGKFSDDFVISQTGGQPVSFALGGGDYWYGDYHTAGGYATTSSRTAGQGKFSVTLGNTTYYNYFPMWVEPVNVVRYARVEYTVKTNLITSIPHANVRQLKETTIPAQRWKPQPSPVEIRRIRRQTRPVSIEREDRKDVRAPVIIRPRP